jgi:hypothetical protein
MSSSPAPHKKTRIYSLSTYKHRQTCKTASAFPENHVLRRKCWVNSVHSVYSNAYVGFPELAGLRNSVINVPTSSLAPSRLPSSLSSGLELDLARVFPPTQLLRRSNLSFDINIEHRVSRVAELACSTSDIANLPSPSTCDAGYRDRLISRR